jgi:hypothetical protein
VNILLQGPHATALAQARDSLRSLARDWGHDITETQAPAGRVRDARNIDPVAVASLALSLPSAALAVADLADRIRKRRRAAELIGQAREQAARQVTITVITAGGITEISTLTPDQLLDLQADPDPAS